MNNTVKTLLSLGIGAAIEYFTTSRPFRTWLKKKAPKLDHEAIDRLANEGIENAKKQSTKL